MNGTDRNYVILALATVVIGLVIGFLENDALGTLMTVISLAACGPTAVMGLYMYMEGKGHRFVNGIDWSGFTPQERCDLSSYVGKYIAIGSILLLVALNILLSQTIIAIVMIVISICMMVFPVGKIYSGSKVKPMPSFGTWGKVACSAIIIAVSIIATAGLGSANVSSGSVSIDFGDSYLDVKAPMFNYSFAYGDIEELELDPDFDKGDRVGGYGTPTISSGRFRNAQFGTYNLASYTQIHPCVWIKYHGGYYAFNQDSDEGTYGIYEQLKLRTGL